MRTLGLGLITGHGAAPPEPDFWLSLLVALIGLGLAAWSLDGLWRKRRRAKRPLVKHRAPSKPVADDEWESGA
jgi:hypothetical protein